LKAGGAEPTADVMHSMPADLKSILNLEVPLIVVIAQRDMAMREVINLAPGAILELPKAADEDLEMMVNNRPIGAGRAVKVGENFGVRVTFVGDLQQRIEALGGANEVKRRSQASPASKATSVANTPPPVLAAPV
jgi:flagellar motor switch protein FliN/FliY